MKTTHPPSLAWSAIGYVAMILIAATAPLTAATHTWIGDSGIIWSDSSDWSTGSIPVSEDSLIFTGDNTDTYNDLTSTITLRHITFDANAGGPFDVEGNAFNIGGTITNNSDYEVTIWNDIQIVGGGGYIPNSLYSAGQPTGSSEGLIIDVGHAGMILAGNITLNHANRAWVKTGKGALTLTGNLDIRQSNIVDMGDLILHGVNVTNNEDSNGYRLILGSGWWSNNDVAGFANSRVILENDSSASFSFIILRSRSGNNSIVVEEGSTFTYTGGLGNLRNNSNSYAYNNLQADHGAATLNIDLTDGGSFLITDAGLNQTILNKPWLTVTETVGEANRTGFVYVSTTNQATVATPYATEYTGGGTVSGTHYHTSGHVVAANSSLSMTTLTITGAGSLTGFPGWDFTSNAILMQEGAGDYLFGRRWTNAAISGSTRYVHQHSTDGILTLDQNITRAGSFVKTGPGTLVFSSPRTSEINGDTDIRGGVFELNGSWGSTSYFLVRTEGTTLRGTGSIGGTAYSNVHILNGGTLDGNYHTAKALDITGSLTFLSDGHYRVDLYEDPLGAPLTVLGLTGDSPQAAVVTLGGDLLLSLLYQPTPYGEDPIVLLRTTGSIVGSFDTINGDPFILGNLLTLSYADQEYWFELGQMDLGGGYTGLVLYTIPEPSTVALLSSVALLGWVYYRRRRR